MPEMFSPLVNFSPTQPKGPAVVSCMQWGKMGSFGSSTAAKEEEEQTRVKNENLRKLSKDLSLGWRHTSEWKKKQRLLELAKQEEAREKIKEEISKEEMELEIKRKQDIIDETQKLLNFDTGRYKEIHQGMMIAEILQENDKTFEIKRERDEAFKLANKKEDEHYLAKVKEELIKDQEKLLKQKMFEKQWQEKRKIQIEDKKEEQKRQFNKEVDQKRFAKKLLENEVTKEKQLQQVEKLERITHHQKCRNDINEKLLLKQKEEKLHSELYQKMMEEQEIMEKRKHEHQQLQTDRRTRISQRQNKAITDRAIIMESVVDNSDKINKEIQEKLDYEHKKRIFEEKDKTMRIHAGLTAFKMKSDIEKREHKEKEKEDAKLAMEKKILADRAYRDQCTEKRENKERERKKIEDYWINQKDELNQKKKNEKETDKNRLREILKTYDKEDDELERYVENLISEEKNKKINLRPIMEAKRKLGLGRDLPLLSETGFIIQPKVSDVFYNPADARNRLSINWDPDKDKDLQFPNQHVQFRGPTGHQ